MTITAMLAIRMLTPFIFAPLQRLVEQHDKPEMDADEHVTPLRPALNVTPLKVVDLQKKKNIIH